MIESGSLTGFNTSTGIFTALSAGKYNISLFFTIGLKINGKAEINVRAGDGLPVIQKAILQTSNSSSSINDNTPVTFNFMVTLNINDKVTVQMFGTNAIYVGGRTTQQIIITKLSN